MSKPRVIVDSRIHIPIKFVDSASIIKKLTKYEFDNAICKTCEFRPIRPSEECRSCSLGGLVDITVLAKLSEKKGQRCVSIPYGELHRFEETTGLSTKEVKFVNKTSQVPFDYKVKFTAELRDYQQEPFDDLLGELSGLLQAPPRSGKTVMGTAGAIATGFKTIIMADQKDFLDGFYETIEQMTNLPDLEEKYGKKLFGFPKKDSDYKDFQIILITYQSLIGDNKTAKKRLKMLCENFGTIFVDEVHAANAACFSRTLANVNMKYRYGLTATPKRKDGKHWIVESVMGPVVAQAFVKELVPKVTLHKTSKKVFSRNKFNNKAGWTNFNKFLANHPDRNDKIFEWIIKDLDAGRSIAIPICFTDQARKLAERINNHYGEEIAVTFLGGAREAKKRKPIIDAARRGDIRCVIGMRRLMQRGLNVPRWDTLYYIMPMNNKPNWKQESCRILTPMENKRTPVIRMFIDPQMEKSKMFAQGVLKFCWEFGYAKAKRTPKKMRNWLGVVSREAALGDDLPDYFEPEAKVKGLPSNLGLRRF